MIHRIAAALAVLLPIGPGAAAQSPRAEAPAPAASSAHLADPTSARTRLGLLPAYERVPGIEALRVAVLDYGFDGLDGRHRYLPESAEVVEHYDAEFVRRNALGDPEFRKPFEPGNRHGRVMAQIVWAMTGSDPRGPKFYLLNANGPTMMRRAVRFAVEHRVDVLLFSGAFEGGGDGDGRGPIDRIVDEAVGAGILWVNSSGNYRRRVYNGPIRILPDGYLRLRSGADVASLRFRNRADENTIAITLTWSDYRDEEDAGTTKDLDLYVEDWAGRPVGSSTNVQITKGQEPGEGRSLNPRERVVLADLAASPEVPADPEYAYRIRIRARKGHFTARDRIRVLLTASREVVVSPGVDGPREAVDFLDASGSGEIYPPADHPLVLTVGDAGPDSSNGPTADGRIKPDVIVEDSRAYLTDGQVTSGSSNAAAYVAGALALLKAAEPRLSPRHLPALVRRSVASTRPVTAGARGGSPLRVWKAPGRAELASLVRGAR